MNTPRTLVASLVFALTLALAPAVQAQSLDAYSSPALALTPPTPTTVHHADRGLVIAGATTLSAAWGLNTIGAALGTAAMQFSDSQDFEILYGLSFVPVAGPVFWGVTALTIDSSYSVLAAIAFIDAGIQALGLGMLIAGLIGVDEPVGQIAEGVTITPVASAAFGGAILEAQW
ncbi:hypothetical protein [Sandaracinus amylolyticus]|uniref:Uncharacterized protein n=1 Tax=Sandaracinus amylolyticus TaxID=927083 RepID=A0A0F6YK13_9BACT|nr:hypothetical protein [Sandaracinus amylolyticus]AKF08766.1 hypothetical protein DB32_005915 [Sandaracinus amylolyticus]